MELPELFEEEPVKQQTTSQTAIQTAATVIMALAGVAAFFQSPKDRHIAWALLGLAVIAVFVLVWPYIQRIITTSRIKKNQIAKDKNAIGKHIEFLRIARRFEKFTNSGDPTTILHIIQESCANDMDKSAAVCPPDYMREILPVFIQHLETRPAENEKQFLLGIQEMSALIASFNREYVSEPFRKMRMKKWQVVNPSVVNQALGTAHPSDPNLGTWLISLPQHYREPAERRIEDFRERWAGFLDDLKEWLDGINEEFGANLHTYFERPQKL